MINQIRNPRVYWLLFLESVLFGLALIIAGLLHFGLRLDHQGIAQMARLLPLVIGVKLVVFLLFGLYKYMWRYASLQEAWTLAQACLVALALEMIGLLFLRELNGATVAILLIDAQLTFIVTGGLRIGKRFLYRARRELPGDNVVCLRPFGPRASGVKSILIIGAGDSGEKLLREIFDNRELSYRVVGLLDDDPGKRGRVLHRIPIFGGVELLPSVLQKHHVDEIVISIPSASGSQMRRIIEICEDTGVPFKTLPAIGQILDGKVSINALRDVRYEDLLRRPPVQLDMTSIRGYITGKRVLVTGAGGSIGSELCRQLVPFEPGELIMVDAGECNLFSIQMELRHEIGFQSHACVLSHVQDESIMEEIFRGYRPEIVFHAAAYKHVPLLERNPWEAVFNNVLGSATVMKLAAKYEVSRFVLVSTDKAVRPTNVMGTTKRLTELVMRSIAPCKTRFMAVRFGNVVGSSGSVIPLFRRQIERGGPVTVTHPEVTRYFMSIPEAAQLILQAGAIGKGGEIFVLEMGEPVKIAEIASDLIRLSGKEPGKDIEIIFTGLRAGEKLHEELVHGGEDVAKTKHKKIMTLKTNGRWNWNGMGTRESFRTWLDAELKDLYNVAATHDASAIKRKLQEIVPEYAPQEAECVVRKGDTLPLRCMANRPNGRMSMGVKRKSVVGNHFKDVS